MPHFVVIDVMSLHPLYIDLLQWPGVFFCWLSVASPLLAPKPGWRISCSSCIHTGHWTATLVAGTQQAAHRVTAVRDQDQV